MKAGRCNEGELTICDLTGVGVQDTAIAVLAKARIEAANLGQKLSVCRPGKYLV
jgi:ornithine cyclodeaminase/alanine dehydrogenase-like protein (mu-crystallin family)